MESDETFKLIVITLLVIIVVSGLLYLKGLNERYRLLEAKCAALQRKKADERLENVDARPDPDGLKETVASLTRMVEESQHRISEAHLVAQRSYADLAAVSERHSERLFQELKALQRLLNDARQKNEVLTAENTELSKEVHELNLKVALLENILATKQRPEASFETRKRNEPFYLPPAPSSSSSSSSSFPSSSSCITFPARSSSFKSNVRPHTKPNFRLLYGDEINLTASIPDKPFGYLSEEADILVRDKRLYKKK